MFIHILENRSALPTSIHLILYAFILRFHLVIYYDLVFIEVVLVFIPIILLIVDHGHVLN